MSAHGSLGEGGRGHHAWALSVGQIDHLTWLARTGSSRARAVAWLPHSWALNHRLAWGPGGSGVPLRTSVKGRTGSPGWHRHFSRVFVKKVSKLFLFLSRPLLRSKLGPDSEFRDQESGIVFV